jgi:hypothetical protein
MEMVTSHSQKRSFSAQPCESPALAIDLMTILSGAANLESLTASGHYAFASLTLACRTINSTLRNLDVSVVSLDTLPMLGYITYFSNLRTLGITLSVILENDSFASLLPWNLLKLKQLTMSLSSGSDAVALTRFLSQCRFPALATLSLSASLHSRKASVHLAVLFKNLKRLTKAKLHVPGIEHRVLSHLTVPQLELTPLNSAMILSLSPKTHNLCFHDSIVVSEIDQLWGILDLLRQNDTGVRAIMIHGSFSWISTADWSIVHPITPFLPRLLRYAAMLSNKDIVIMDGNEQTVLDYFTGTSASCLVQ